MGPDGGRQGSPPRRDVVGENTAAPEKSGFFPIPWLFAVVLVVASSLISGALTSYFHERSRADVMDQAIAQRIDRFQERTEQHFEQHRKELAEITATGLVLRAELEALKAGELASLRGAVKVCRDDIEILQRRMLLRESRP